MNRNTQTPETAITSDGAELIVHSVFYTIQGEGPYSGMPAVFIRLAGCNLQCPGCDTIYADVKNTRSTNLLTKEVVELFPLTHRMPKLVVITGGEPLRQNITPLIKMLQVFGLLVQIETNGTLAPQEPIPQGVRVVCSPKAGKVNPGLIQYISCYKYVLDHHAVSVVDGLPVEILAKQGGPARPHAGFPGAIYVSPMDVQNKDLNELNMHTAAVVCKKYGYILNLQIHKIVGLP